MGKNNFREKKQHGEQNSVGFVEMENHLLLKGIWET